MTKHYKNQQLMKFLTIIGALVGLVYIISGFASLTGIGFVPIIVIIVELLMFQDVTLYSVTIPIFSLALGLPLLI
ncbi:unnamed protein product, partial [marine sediment metagenome]